jgi:hypothetical protein
MTPLEDDLYSDEMDAAVAAFVAVHHGCTKNAERAGETVDGEAAIRRALASALDPLLAAQREADAKIAHKAAEQWRSDAEELLSDGQRDPAMRCAARAEAAEKIAAAIRTQQDNKEA